jgi:hypothetical protein
MLEGKTCLNSKDVQKKKKKKEESSKNNKQMAGRPTRFDTK